MNRKGFTLIELLATLVILAIVLSIGGYSIVQIMKSSKDENYNVLVKNIMSAGETYYQECKYSKETIIKMFNGNEPQANSFCDYNVTLNELIQHGYLTGNNGAGNMGLVDPRDETIDLSNCSIKVSYNNGKVTVTKNDSNANCPTY